MKTEELSAPPDGAYRYKRVLAAAIPIAVLLVMLFAVPRPESIAPAGWRLFGLFAATIAALILHPIPGGAIVLIAVTLSSLIGGLTIGQALAGYADPTVWLVMAAFFISRSLLKTGLARRIALFFVRTFGQSSLGVSYALALSDLTLAGIIPSNGARSGGVVLPIVRSIAELYGSKPGATAGMIGSFLMVAVYQSICVTASMFFTGQASNPLAASIAGQFGVKITWASWFVAGIVPGLVSLMVVPWIVMKLYPPEVRRTPEAAEFAAGELRKMGPLSRGEKILAVVFVSVCGLWVSSGWHGLDVAVSAMLGSAALLLTGVLQWEDVLTERAAWDIFIWYGGLLRLGKALNDAGITKFFAESLGAFFPADGWYWMFAVCLLVYFYAHYGFASITAHILAMYPPFVALLISKGAPPALMCFAFACFANLSAGLTNYGTTPSPMFFAQGYVPMGAWWRVGAVISVVNLTVWGTLGFAWWKVLGLW